jgi:tryptophan synthase beta chain
MACVGGGSNAIGIFHAFRDNEEIDLIGVEAGGHGTNTDKHASRFNDPDISRPGILHGTRSYVMQNDDGQIMETHSISAGLDYPSVGPEHAYLRSLERAFYTSATDEETMQAFQMLSEYEGIIPALESAHAVAEVIKRAPQMSQDKIILINMSGRGDKDLDTVIEVLGDKLK